MAVMFTDVDGVCGRILPVTGTTVYTVVQTSLAVTATVPPVLLIGLMAVVAITGTEVVVTSMTRKQNNKIKHQWCFICKM